MQTTDRLATGETARLRAPAGACAMSSARSMECAGPEQHDEAGAESMLPTSHRVTSVSFLHDGLVLPSKDRLATDVADSGP